MVLLLCSFKCYSSLSGMKDFIVLFITKTSAYVGTTVKFVLEQDKAAFLRLIVISVLQSAASSFIAPSLR